MNRLWVLLVSALLWLAACAGPPPPTPTPTPTPEELLDRAAQAMLEMKSAKWLLVREGESVVLDQTLGLSFTEARGEYQAPDRVKATVKVVLLGSPIEIQMLWLPEGNYMTNPLTQSFVRVPSEMALDGSVLFSEDGVPAVLRDGIQNIRLFGSESLDGIETYHLQGQADGAQLTPLTAGALQAGSAYPVDIWIEVDTWNVVRLQIHESEGDGWLIDLFEIDEPVEIPAP